MTLAEEKLDTRERLLDAAERLFGERGFKGTSLRAITVEAGANVASVSYHFGSKLELLKAVLVRAYGYVADRQLEFVDALQAEQTYSLDDIVETMVVPFFELSEADRARMQRVSQLIGRLLCTRDPEVRRALVGKRREIEERYVRLLRVPLPDVPDDELRWRYKSCIGLVIQDQTDPVIGEDETPKDSLLRERLSNLVRAAMAAKPASSGRGGRD